MKKIVCFHLFNDYSGSPKVLKTIIEGLLNNGHCIDLVTSRGGVLDELQDSKGLKFRQYRYTFARNKFIRLLRYAWVQLHTFFTALGYVFKKETVIYINTVLPIGAALGGKLAGKRVVYHYHENAKAKGISYRILSRLMQLIASEIICVSHYQRAFVRRKNGVVVIPNALRDDFAAEVHPCAEKSFEQQRVLMLGSLKSYKGTREFIELANALQLFSFELVLNDTKENIDNYISCNNITLPGNLTIHPRQKDVTQFYNRASLVVNLSNRNLFIETFGLTALEAMTAGLPVIVPTVGGIAEMVTDGVNGYKIDVQNLKEIEETVKSVLTNKDLYLSLANNSLNSSKKYGTAHLIDSIEKILCSGCISK